MRREARISDMRMVKRKRPWKRTAITISPASRSKPVRATPAWT